MFVIIYIKHFIQFYPMNKISFLLIFIILSNINVIGQIPQDFVAYYPLDNNAFDYSTYGFNGYTYAVQSVPGVFNDAYNFNGVNSKIVTSGDNRNITNVVTLSAWIKTSSQNDYGFVISKYDWRIDKGFHLSVWFNGHAFLGGRNTGNNYIMVQSQMPVNDGKWHHLLGVINGNTWKLWVDCELQNTFNSSALTPDLTNNEALSFGYYPLGDNGNHRYFNGEIDEIYLYNRELTPVEKQTLCDRNPTAIETDEDSNLLIKSFINIFPNPVNDNLTIQSNKQIKNIILFDETGKILIKKTIHDKISRLKFTTQTKGVYFIKIEFFDGEVLLKKIIKK